MTLEPRLIGELLLLGSCTGFMAGFLGIGGATLLVPFTTLILSHRGVDAQLAVKYAIATSMTVILFTSVSSAWAHHRRGAVIAVVVPGPGRRYDEVAGLHWKLLARDRGVGALALDDEAQRARRVPMRRRDLARQDDLQPGEQ